jgi:hypothetical protein
MTPAVLAVCDSQSPAITERYVDDGSPAALPLGHLGSLWKHGLIGRRAVSRKSWARC